VSELSRDVHVCIEHRATDAISRDPAQTARCTQDVPVTYGVTGDVTLRYYLLSRSDTNAEKADETRVSLVSCLR